MLSSMTLVGCSGSCTTNCSPGSGCSLDTDEDQLSSHLMSAGVCHLNLCLENKTLFFSISVAVLCRDKLQLRHWDNAEENLLYNFSGDNFRHSNRQEACSDTKRSPCPFGSKAALLQQGCWWFCTYQLCWGAIFALAFVLETAVRAACHACVGLVWGEEHFRKLFGMVEQRGMGGCRSEL